MTGLNLNQVWEPPGVLDAEVRKVDSFASADSYWWCDKERRYVQDIRVVASGAQAWRVCATCWKRALARDSMLLGHAIDLTQPLIVLATSMPAQNDAGCNYAGHFGEGCKRTATDGPCSGCGGWGCVSHFKVWVGKCMKCIEKEEDVAELEVSDYSEAEGTEAHAYGAVPLGGS